LPGLGGSSFGGILGVVLGIVSKVAALAKSREVVV